MKKYVITFIILAVVLSLVAGAILLINKLFYAAEEGVIVTSDFIGYSGADKITVNIDIGYVNVTEREGSDKITFEFSSFREDFYSVDVTDGTVSISSDGLRWYDRERLNTADKYGVTIGIPADFEGELLIDTAAGSVAVSDIGTNEVVINTKSGDVSASKITANAVSAITDSGDVTLSGIASSNVTASTNKGSVTFSDIETSSLLYASFSSHVGNVVGSFDLPSDRFAIETTATGESNVVSGGEGIELFLSARVGNIDVTFGE